MKAGDVVKIYAPVAGYNKYHFCVCIPENETAGKFLYLNSDPEYRDTLSIDCSRIPFLPPSRTGKTAVSFTSVARYNTERLELFQAEVLGEMPDDIIHEMFTFAQSVRSLTRSDKQLVIEVLEALLSK